MNDKKHDPDHTSHHQLVNVREAIARHLAVDALAIEDEHRLEQDWGLNSLDLMLILARLEDTADFELPLDLLRHVETVGELSRFVDVCVRQYQAHRSGWLPPSASLLREQLRRTARRERRERAVSEARKDAARAARERILRSA